MFLNPKDRLSPPLALILGCSGTVLTEEEKGFFAQVNPLGFILFAWNIESVAQVKSLTQSLKDVLQRENVIILIDVEGGRVNRLEKLGYTWPEAASYEKNDGLDQLNLAWDACFDSHQTMGKVLEGMHILVDCAPVLDLRVPGAHEIIGSRAFSESPDVVGYLGQAAIKGLWEGGVCPVVKHIPGHGAALVDSHVGLPVVELPPAQLEDHFKPFQKAMEIFPDYPFMAMTAHIVYTAIDPAAPATLSKKVVEQVIRQKIGFHGLLISDDLDMQAIQGDPETKVRLTLEAGCDVALFAKGGLDVWGQAVQGAQPLTERALACLDLIFASCRGC